MRVIGRLVLCLLPLASVAALAPAAARGAADDTAISELLRPSPSAERRQARRWRHQAMRRVGVMAAPMTEQLRLYFGAPRDHGLLVVRIERESAGERAGLQIGDVILSVDDAPARRPRHLLTPVGLVPEGEPIYLEVLRDGEVLRLSLVPRGRPLPLDARVFRQPRRGW